MGTGESRFSGFQKLFQPFGKVLGERNKTFLVALAEHLEHHAAKIQVLYFQFRGLTPAHSGGVKGFEQNPGEQTAIIVRKFNMGKKGRHLAFLHKNREPFAHAWRRYFAHGILFDQPALFQKFEISFEARKSADNASWILAGLH